MARLARRGRERGPGHAVGAGRGRAVVVVLLALVPLARAQPGTGRRPHGGRRGRAGRRGRGRGRRARGGRGPTAPSWCRGGRRGSTCGSSWSSARPERRPRPGARPLTQVRQGPQGPALHSASMSPDQPGAPAPSETGGTATFGPGVEQAERGDDRVATSRRGGAARGGASRTRPARRAARPRRPRRRLLDDPDPAVPKAPRRVKVRARKVQPHRAPHRAVVGAEALRALLPVDLPDHLRRIGAPVERGARAPGRSTTSRASSPPSGSGTARTSMASRPPRRRRPRRRSTAPASRSVARPHDADHRSRRRRPRSRRPCPTRTATAPRASGSSAASSSRTSRSSRRSPSAGWCSCWPARPAAWCWRCCST